MYAIVFAVEILINNFINLKDMELCKIKIEKSCTDTTKNNQNIYTPKGEKIPGVVWTRVWDCVDDQQYVIAKILIEI